MRKMEGLRLRIKDVDCFAAGIRKKVSCHTFRHTFATKVLETDLRHSQAVEKPPVLPSRR